jgi:hypothetical protein
MQATHSPQVAIQEGLEVNHRADKPVPYGMLYDSNANQYGGPKERIILGLRVTTFLLSLALVVVIIGAAVGGGVGGSFAAKHKSGSQR